ncbi:hypothetical protein D1AOALGA4SA_2010 [Olavius algarvensis Delta 1 endosymbiont]|nr:hypothetical protein D1AOALGA4SA_2010 [Olavius algarvensis Delta 1 endosymbiont]
MKLSTISNGLLMEIRQKKVLKKKQMPSCNVTRRQLMYREFDY